MMPMFGGLEEPTSPFHDETFSLTSCRRLCLNGQGPWFVIEIPPVLAAAMLQSK